MTCDELHATAPSIAFPCSVIASCSSKALGSSTLTVPDAAAAAAAVAAAADADAAPADVASGASSIRGATVAVDVIDMPVTGEV